MKVQRLGPGDEALFEAMLDLFGEVFDERDTYGKARPGPAYRDRLLASDGFAALVAVEDGVVGALAAYEMVKFEQERSEFYIYDLAVDAAHRRRGIATALIAAMGEIAAARGAWTMFVQADMEDGPAIELYRGYGPGEPMLHFDILTGRS